MKIIRNNIIALAALIVVNTGCSGFLDQDNRSNTSQTSFYSTEDGFTSLVTSAYSTLRTIYGSDPWLFSAGTDLYASGRNTVDDIGLLGAGYNNSLASVNTFYKNCYKAISLCNDVVYYGNKLSDFDKKNQYVDEARFLRAYYDFLLVENFGDVVLFKERQTSGSTFFTRSSEADAYKYIISELTELAGSDSNLPDKHATSGTEFYRIDKRTVNHYLAKVYLTRAYESCAESTDFANAKAAADKVISASNTLNSQTFSKVFDINNQQNDEVIFSCEYSKNSESDPSTDGNKQQAEFGTYLNGQEDGHKYTTSTLTPTLRMHQLFSKNDDRYEATFMTTLYNHYFDYYNKTAAELTNDKVYAYYPPEWACADTTAWRNASKSRTDTKIIPMTESGFNVQGKVTAYESKMTEDVYGVSCFRKFDDPTTDINNGGYFSVNCSAHDIFLARVAEDYLIAAEASIKLGNTSDALNYINNVRERANAADASESDLTIDYILDERARELAGEYHRWEDLKRTGKLMEYTIKYNPDIRNNGGAKLYVGNDGENKILRPIPLAAMELNGGLTQNPGY